MLGFKVTNLKTDRDKNIFYNKAKIKALKKEIEKLLKQLHDIDVTEELISSLEFERGKDVLAYQTELMNRSMKMSHLNNIKRVNTGENTISNQIAIQKNLTIFNRKLNHLKSQSVTKKTHEEKMKIFRELKRKEVEKKKKEKEDEMYNNGQ